MLSLHSDFDIPKLLKTIINKCDKPEDAYRLVQGSSTEHKHLLIHQLTTNKHSAKAATFIQKFKFNHEDFPLVVERIKKKFVRY